MLRYFKTWLADSILTVFVQMGLFAEVTLFLSLILGTIVAAFTSRKFLGRPTSLAMQAIEPALFILLVLGVLPFVNRLSDDLLILSSAYFALSLASMLIASLVSTAFGLKGDKQEPRSLEELSSKQRTAEKILNLLLDAGFPKQSCRHFLLSCGFSPAVVDRVLAGTKRQHAPHPLTRRVAELEEQLRSKKSSGAKAKSAGGSR